MNRPNRDYVQDEDGGVDIEALRQQSLATFNSLIPILANKVRHRFPELSKEDIEEILSDLHFRISNKVDYKRHQNGLGRGYFFRAVRNMVLNKRRQRIRNARRKTSLKSALDQSPNDETPEEALMIYLLRKRLHEAISACLNDDEKNAIQYHFLGFTNEDTGTALKIPTGTVASRLKSARKKLGKYLRKKTQ